MVTQAIDVDSKLAKELEKLAKRTGRPAAALASDALREYLGYTRRLLDDVDAAQKDLKAGRVFTRTEVEGHLDAQRAARKKKRKTTR